MDIFLVSQYFFCIGLCTYICWNVFIATGVMWILAYWLWSLNLSQIIDEQLKVLRQAIKMVFIHKSVLKFMFSLLSI